MANPELSSATLQWSVGRSSEKSELKQQTLMIVDDYESNLHAMEALFKLEYNVVLQTNGRDAIDYAIKQDVDLILLDIDMPEMNGYEACAALRSNVLTAHIPIIFVTAADSQEEEEKGLLLGAVDYVVKPVNLSILRTRVRNQMESIQYRKKLEMLSCVDGLTGASNRRQLDTMLLQNYASTIRYGNCLALLMIDIDNFKQYNDTYGHLKGDQCLKLVADTIMSVRRRDTDIVGRYGGEEFAVVLPDTDVEGALVVANKLLKSIRDLKIEHSGSPNDKIVTISIGLAVFEAKHGNHQEISLDEFVNHADKQLYASKHNGKNCVSYTSVNTAVTETS